MNVGQLSLIAFLQLYRRVFSPAMAMLFGPLGRCRHTPTCSAYAIEAVRIHGAFIGSWHSLKRLCRCHPWGSCGYDPVPFKTSFPTGNADSRMRTTLAPHVRD